MNIHSFLNAVRFVVIFVALCLPSCSPKVDFTSLNGDAKLKGPTNEELAEARENWSKLEAVTLAHDTPKLKALTDQFLFFECDNEAGSDHLHWTAHAAFELTEKEKAELNASIAQKDQARMWELIQKRQHREDFRPHFACVLRPTVEQRASLSNVTGFSRKLSIYGKLQTIDLDHKQIIVGPIYITGLSQG